MKVLRGLQSERCRLLDYHGMRLSWQYIIIIIPRNPSPVYGDNPDNSCRGNPDNLHCPAKFIPWRARDDHIHELHNLSATVSVLKFSSGMSPSLVSTMKRRAGGRRSIVRSVRSTGHVITAAGDPPSVSEWSGSNPNCSIALVWRRCSVRSRFQATFSMVDNRFSTSKDCGTICLVLQCNSWVRL